MIKRVVKGLANLAGFQIFRNDAKLRISRRDDNYEEDGLFTVHSDVFRNREDFRAAYARGLKTSTAVPWNGDYVPGTFSQWRVHIALWCASTAARLDGDFVECGVFVGFMSSSIMKFLDWNGRGKMFYLIDTFEGPDMDQFSAEEVNRGRKEEVEQLRKIGGYDYSFETAQRNFQEWRNVKLIKGLVPDVLPECPSEKVAYLHLDMNCALPEISALRFFWNKMPQGGIVLLDDYAYRGFVEQHKAMDTLAEELGFAIASLPTGQGLIVKT